MKNRLLSPLSSVILFLSAFLVGIMLSVLAVAQVAPPMAPAQPAAPAQPQPSAPGMAPAVLNILEFQTMAAVPRPFTGPMHAIRGVPGGGLPWVIATATGKLTTTGRLEITVTGLVLDPTDQAVMQAGTGGTNPIPNFVAIVSCMTKDAMGNAEMVNMMTVPFPATAAGNAKIEAQVELPKPCIAPIIFVGNPEPAPTGAWFATTGH
ncbi:hypothetical protein [Nitrosomonas sp. Nm33]|uniref:hypothetical protein n=1 Tax=Nitrosomonas sp. Nm33 TaxID=133724 RepID=UPI00089ADE39|nr:hypothetical protein [Nitrosomonas sp. Nm33]SDY95341.1 hypothetical protein SAMN05421755_10716 [Nitrosomonas sp. Nm33]